MAENYITKKYDKGSISISEEVLAGVVRTAALEVEGVYGFASTAGAEIADFIGIKTFSRGVKATFTDDTVVIDLLITVRYGFNLVTVAEKVQEEVLDAVLDTTGIGSAEVNVHVTGIAF